jgi:hypothetical protein
LFGLEEISPVDPLDHVFPDHFRQHLQMEIHRSSIRVDLNARHLGFVLVEVHIEGDQLGLFFFNVFYKLLGELLIVLEPALLDLPGAHKD